MKFCLHILDKGRGWLSHDAWFIYFLSIVTCLKFLPSLSLRVGSKLRIMRPYIFKISASVKINTDYLDREEKIKGGMSVVEQGRLGQRC